MNSYPRFKMEILSRTNKKRHFFPWISGIDLDCNPKQQSTTSHILTSGAVRVRARRSASCAWRSSGRCPGAWKSRFRAGAERRRRWRPSRRLPETLEPAGFEDRAGTRTRPLLSSECAIFKSQVLWAAARTWEEAVEAVVLVLRRPTPSPPSPPVPFEGRGAAGASAGSFRCQTAVSDSAALDSDVFQGFLCACVAVGARKRGAGTFLFSVSLLFEGLLDSFSPTISTLKETFGPL